MKFKLKEYFDYTYSLSDDGTNRDYHVIIDKEELDNLDKIYGKYECQDEIFNSIYDVQDYLSNIYPIVDLYYTNDFEDVLHFRIDNEDKDFQIPIFCTRKEDLIEDWPSAESQREKYHNDPEFREKQKARRRQYYKNNKDLENDRSTLYSLEHRDRLSQIAKERYQNKRDELIQQSKERYNKIKDDPEFKKKNYERKKRWRAEQKLKKLLSLDENTLTEKRNTVKVGDPIPYEQAKKFYDRGYIDLLVTNEKGESETIKGFHSNESQKEIGTEINKKGIERPVANKVDIPEFSDIIDDIKSRLGDNITITTINPQTNQTVYNTDDDENVERVTGTAYKLFKQINGKLYPPMVNNPGGVDTPIGKWMKCGAPEFKEISAGWGKPQTSGTTLSYRPGWHLGELPYAPQFEKTSKPGYLSKPNFVWALCEYNATVDYQDRAMSYGYSKNGKFTNSAAGLPYRPNGGYYKYRTNPNPDTIAWVITGEMKVIKVLDWDEVEQICKENNVPFLKPITKK